MHQNGIKLALHIHTKAEFQAIQNVCEMSSTKKKVNVIAFKKIKPKNVVFSKRNLFKKVYCFGLFFFVKNWSNGMWIVMPWCSSYHHYITAFNRVESAQVQTLLQFYWSAVQQANSSSSLSLTLSSIAITCNSFQMFVLEIHKFKAFEETRMLECFAGYFTELCVSNFYWISFSFRLPLIV